MDVHSFCKGKPRISPVLPVSPRGLRLLRRRLGRLRAGRQSAREVRGEGGTGNGGPEA